MMQNLLQVDNFCCDIVSAMFCIIFAAQQSKLLNRLNFCYFPTLNMMLC